MIKGLDHWLTTPPEESEPPCIVCGSYDCSCDLQGEDGKAVYEYCSNCAERVLAGEDCPRGCDEPYTPAN